MGHQSGGFSPYTGHRGNFSGSKGIQMGRRVVFYQANMEGL